MNPKTRINHSEHGDHSEKQSVRVGLINHHGKTFRKGSGSKDSAVPAVFAVVNGAE